MRSPMKTQEAMVAALAMRGMMELSAIRRLRTPFTRNLASTTAIESLPILQLPLSWKYVVAPLRTKFSMDWPVKAFPGTTSRLESSRSGAALPMVRHISMPTARALTSSGWLRKLASMIGRSAGLADLSVTVPRLFGATKPAHSAQLAGGGGGEYSFPMTSLAYGSSIWTRFRSGVGKLLWLFQNPEASAALLRCGMGSLDSQMHPP